MKSQSEAMSEEMKKLVGAEIGLCLKRVAKRAKVASVEASLGQAAVDAEDGDHKDLAARLVAARAELDVLAAGCRAAHAKRLDLIRRWYRIRAEETKARVREGELEIERHRERTKKALGMLAELEEVPAEQLFAMDPIALAWHHQCSYQSTVVLSVEPRVERLREAVRELSIEAERLERAKPFEVACEGQVDAPDLAELLSAMLADPSRVTPAADAVATWVAEATAVERPWAKPRFHLHYRGEEICDGSAVMWECAA